MLDTRLSLKNKLVQTIMAINIFIFALLFVVGRVELLVFFAAATIIVFLFIQVIVQPQRAFFLFFGIKITFDTLWFLKKEMTIFGSFGILELSLLPMIPMLLFGSKIDFRSLKKLLVPVFVYLFWVTLAMLVNRGMIEVDTLVRQSGILLGLAAGMKYIKTKEEFNLLIYVIFLSTLIPVVASTMQLLPIFSNLPIFHSKLDYVRQIRLSGLYYDAGTSGMVNLVSFLCNSYLAFAIVRTKRLFNYQLLFIPVNLFLILAGGTRSILIAAILILAFFLLRRKMIKTTVLMLPVLFIVFQLSGSYINGILERSKSEKLDQVSIREMFQETDNRTLFTGRMGIWQDILDEVGKGSFYQRLLGKGISSNAHSTIFFLILQIGWLGVITFYLTLLYFLRRIIVMKSMGLPKMIALFAIIAFFVIGFSLTTVVFTSFQWIVFLLVGSVLSIHAHSTYAKQIEQRNPRSL